jgi:hypothetical protein
LEWGIGRLTSIGLKKETIFDWVDLVGLRHGPWARGFFGPSSEFNSLAKCATVKASKFYTTACPRTAEALFILRSKGKFGA